MNVGVFQFDVSRQLTTPRWRSVPPAPPGMTTTHLVRFSNASGIVFSDLRERCLNRRAASLSNATGSAFSPLRPYTIALAAKRNNAKNPTLASVAGQRVFVILDRFDSLEIELVGLLN